MNALTMRRGSRSPWPGRGAWRFLRSGRRRRRRRDEPVSGVLRQRKRSKKTLPTWWDWCEINFRESFYWNDGTCTLAHTHKIYVYNGLVTISASLSPESHKRQMLQRIRGEKSFLCLRAECMKCSPVLHETCHTYKQGIDHRDPWITWNLLIYLHAAWLHGLKWCGF